MNKPWQVLADVKELVDRVGWQDFQVQLFEILQADDPEGVWLPGDREVDRDFLEDDLGLDWDEVKDIFEEELAQEIRNHAPGYH